MEKVSPQVVSLVNTLDVLLNEGILARADVYRFQIGRRLYRVGLTTLESFDLGRPFALARMERNLRLTESQAARDFIKAFVEAFDTGRFRHYNGKPEHKLYYDSPLGEIALTLEKVMPGVWTC
jgi:hypothetical protein